MKKVYFHFNDLEEFHGGMWRGVHASQRSEFPEKAAALMRDTDGFTAAMRMAVLNWPNSCAQNLSNSSINHLAWLGHAGCCIATASPEDCTRAGWSLLNQDEQDAANAAAQTVVNEWRASYAEKAITV